MSQIQRALESAKKGLQQRRQADKSTAPDVGRTEALKDVTRAHVESQIMEKNKILPAIDDKSTVAAYKMLRTRVLQRMRTNEWRTLVITGAGPGEGKTLTACNLAVSLSEDVNQWVVLVDLDLQRPMLAKYFGLDVKAGIGDYLTGNARAEEIMYAPDGMERLIVIPNREPVLHASELISSPRMRELLEGLRSSGPSTITVFDMPPVLACDDVLAFAPYADAILLIASEGITERDSLTRTMELLGERNVLGVVLNRSREHNSASPYYY
jgi:protein-tyrosine kinase